MNIINPPIFITYDYDRGRNKLKMTTNLIVNIISKIVIIVEVNLKRSRVG